MKTTQSFGRTNSTSITPTSRQVIEVFGTRRLSAPSRASRLKILRPTSRCTTSRKRAKTAPSICPGPTWTTAGGRFTPSLTRSTPRRASPFLLWPSIRRASTWRMGWSSVRWCAACLPRNPPQVTFASTLPNKKSRAAARMTRLPQVRPLLPLVIPEAQHLPILLAPLLKTGTLLEPPLCSASCSRPGHLRLLLWCLTRFTFIKSYNSNRLHSHFIIDSKE
mmetsp:Transcript_22304/g.32924  ORF Transcript_22304/g.32924 Transcript_22304/m.32924 type:complete len:221 (-) Transcript_22304:98-760(-)